MIADLLVSPESKTLEFKRDLSSPKPLLKTLVAFANTAGGRIIIGVTDAKKIIGTEDPLAEEERLCNLIADSIAPRLVPNIEMMTIAGKTVIIAEVFPSDTEFHDALPKAVESIMLFLKKHAMRAADLSGIRRKDVWSIPLTILREVVINALVHADYSQRGAPIRISFFDDRIEVENPGIFLPGMTVEDMKQGISRIRNPVLARVFRELNLIEQWGSGVRRIFEQAAQQNLPTPEILEIGMRVRFIIPFETPIKVKKPESRPESRPESKLAVALIEALSGDPLGKIEIARALGHKTVSGELKKNSNSSPIKVISR